MIAELVCESCFFPLYKEEKEWTLPQDVAVHSDSVIKIFLAIMNV